MHAVAAGNTETIWTIDHIVEIMELYATKPGKRGWHKKSSEIVA